jgi:hypothetical protein
LKSTTGTYSFDVVYEQAGEIGRKLTSLTLMTIMLAGGMVIAAPSMVPEAAAAGQLYVSVENAQFGNLFAGANIVEVIVRDPNRADTEVAESEPTVKVDNQLLRMAQGADGYWYAYLGDDTTITAMDVQQDALVTGNTVLATNLIFGVDLPLGQDHLSVDGAGNAGLTTEATSVFLTAGAGVIDNPPILSDYNGTGEFTMNADQSSTIGQIGLNNSEWPFIQTFDFTQEDFDIVLEQAGADEVVTIEYNNSDMDDYAELILDRNAATQGAEVHMFINDQHLNIDPTDEDVVIFLVNQDGLSASSSMTWTNGTMFDSLATGYDAQSRSTIGFDDNGILLINYNTNNALNEVLVNDATQDDPVGTINSGSISSTGSNSDGDYYLVFYEDADNTGTFSNIDNLDNSNINVNDYAARGTTATFDYNDSAQSFVVANDFGTINMDAASVGSEWNSGEELAVTLTDQDLNLNSINDEDLTIDSDLIPTMIIGSPLTLGDDTTIEGTATTVASFSKIANVTATLADKSRYTQVSAGWTIAQYRTAVDAADYRYISYNLASVIDSTSAVKIFDQGLTAISTATLTATSGVVALNASAASGTTDLTETDVALINFTGTSAIDANDRFYVDIIAFGDGDTTSDRVNNAIYRLVLEENGDNTGVFEGSVEYVMLNQLNTDSSTVFDAIDTFDDSIDIIVHEDLTDEDSPRINYFDLGADGVSTQISDQLEAPTHSGVVSFDLETYKTADTVVVTLDDQDMNVDSELIDVYLTQTDDYVGNSGTDHLVDITFDDSAWDGLYETGFTLVETEVDSGIFVGSFQVPSSQTGKDIEVNYNDHRDASGETIEVGDGASIRANTGSVAFDRTVYPVPFGNETANQRFALHSAAANLNGGSSENALAQGDVTVHVRVTDADYDVSASGEDTIADTTVVIKLERGSNSTTIATVGDASNPIYEVSPNSGVFEYDQTIDYNDGVNNDCPSVFTGGSGCVLQGDIITVTYTDKADASGQEQTVTDSATFDLRNGVLQSDKSVYLIGSDMILTLIEPDFDLDNDGAESYTLDLIEWDSDAATTSMGAKGVSGAAAAFDPEPSSFRETGDSTGIFQVVIEIPDTLDSEKLDRGEMIELEYTDWGPAGADYVGQEDEDIGLTVYTSNFGATIELDQKVYTWTDKVYITIVAPDHNFDSGLVDEIGNTSDDPIKVSTRGNELSQYKLVESSADSGIFIGEVTLAGMIHDADGDGVNDITSSASTLTTGSGPTEGTLATTDNDGLTVSFEFSEDETVVGSALIRWNIGEVQWLEASYPASGTGVIRVIDADMNLNPEAIDNFAVDAWSDSDAGGIDLTVTETNEATGIFEGTVFFTTVNDLPVIDSE